MKMNELTVKDKLFFFEKHFFTLDGLWMIETENKIGWDKALKIDLDVWIKLLKVIFRRLSKYLHIQTNDIEDLIEMEKKQNRCQSLIAAIVVNGCLFVTTESEFCIFK